jgi:hypothetical protein
VENEANEGTFTTPVQRVRKVADETNGNKLKEKKEHCLWLRRSLLADLAKDRRTPAEASLRHQWFQCNSN